MACPSYAHGLLGIYRAPKARDVTELAFFTGSTGRAFDTITRPICLHIKPETERTAWNISGVIEIDLHFGSHLGPYAFDASYIVPEIIGLPLLELGEFGSGP